MKAVILIGAAALGLVCTSAQAQDLSGFRIEGRAGWDRTGAKADLPNPAAEDNDAAEEFLTAANSRSKIAYGFELGYDAQIAQSLVVGAYAGMDLSRTQNCSELIEDDLACLTAGRTFAVGLRAGVPLGTSSLIYVKGGYANRRTRGSYDLDVTDNEASEPGEVFNFSKNRAGYQLGAGAEFGLSKGLYAKLEYVYSDFGRNSFALGEDAPGNLGLSSDRHQVLVGAGLRF